MADHRPARVSSTAADGETREAAFARLSKVQTCALLLAGCLTLSLAFSYGYIVQLSSRVVDYLTVRDLFSLSVSHLVYAVLPLGAFALVIEQMIPAITLFERRVAPDIQERPRRAQHMLVGAICAATATFVVAVYVLNVAFDIFPVGSLLKNSLNTVLPGVVAVAFFPLIIAVSALHRNDKTLLILTLFLLQLCTIAFYLGDMISAYDRQHAERQDCAYLDHSSRCMRVVLLGERFVITRSPDGRISAVPVASVDRFGIGEAGSTMASGER